MDAPSRVRLSTIILFQTLIYHFHCSGYGTIAAGMATISPPEVALVCRGYQLEVICSVSGSFLQWSFSLIPEGEAIPKPYTFTITSLNRDNQTQNLRVNSTIFTFARTSLQNSLPLVSSLTVNATSDGLNGTVVTCSNVETSQSASTTINIINMVAIKDHTVELTVISEEYEQDGVIVTLEWAEDNSYYSYNISVSPWLEVMLIGRAGVQLKVPYNTLHNVSAAAISHCQQNNMATFIGTSLYYNTCRSLANMADQGIKIIGDSDPAVDGSNITFGCLLEFLPFISICMKSGDWVPDPEDIELNCSDQSSGIMMTTLPDRNPWPGRLSYGSILGGVFGVVFLVVTSIILASVTVCFIKTKNKGANSDNRQLYYDTERYTSHNRSTDIKLSPASPIDKTAPGGQTIVYADIGQSFSRQLHHVISTHDLDDDTIEYAKLNHNLLSTTVTSWNPQPADKITNSLCVNLDNLLIQLRPQVGTNWYQFGEAAGIEKEVLDECAKSCSPDDCIVEMLDYWLRNGIQQPTWKDVSEVLKAINLPQLAHDIDNIYTTGKLPLGVDMNSVPKFEESCKSEPVQAELPPPIPPKLIDHVMDQDVHDRLDRVKQRIATESDDHPSAPALPPKPTDRSGWSKAK